MITGVRILTFLPRFTYACGMAYRDKHKQREYQRQWKARRRDQWIADHGPCANCGSHDDLEVDHLDPKVKDHHISRIWSYRAEVRDAELAKCQVLCNPCHLAKTIDQRSAVAQHGTHSKYNTGCRCRECKKAHATYAREWRAKK